MNWFPWLRRDRTAAEDRAAVAPEDASDPAEGVPVEAAEAAKVVPATTPSNAVAPAEAAPATPATTAVGMVAPDEVAEPFGAASIPPGAPRVSAATLWAAFQENQVTAEDLLKGMDLAVEGVVDHVDRDRRDRIRVHFKVASYRTMPILFPDEARAVVASLRSGVLVRIAARVKFVDVGDVVLEATYPGA